MKRYYFIGKNLDDFESIERALEARGIVVPQIHVLSQDDAGVKDHHLNEVHSVLKKDVIHSGEIGALIGLAVSFFSIAVAYLCDLQDVVGWVPFVLFSLILLGFFTWEGGLFGIQVPNSRFRQFEEALRSDKHVFFVDVQPEQETVLQQVVAAHPQVEQAGTGISAPRWIIVWQTKWREFLHWAP
jgi:hypothetical protein